MNEKLQSIIQTIVDEFKAETYTFAGDTSLVLTKDTIIPALKRLRELGFDLCSDITAVDYLPAEPRFHIVYRLTGTRIGCALGVRVAISGINPSAPTAEGVWKSANWREREIFDMFGITFEGHSDMRRILMPEGWEGHPLRKDYPLGYEEPQHTFNFDEIDARKPYAKE
jgi:NADH-quinone oxidoreductase subunit C